MLTHKWQKALELLVQMQQKGREYDNSTCRGTLLDCAEVAFGDGSCIPDQIIHSSYKHDVFVFSGLIIHIPTMGARRMLAIVFNRMSAHDVVAWNAMIFVHAQCGKGQKALKLYQQM
jgi:pentatricopeptide repeat protein